MSNKWCVHVSFSQSLVLGFVVWSLGCQSESLPQAYGVYAETEAGRVSLRAQRVEIKGNMLSFVSGLRGPSGLESRAISAFVVFEKDLVPSSIGLERLSFTSSVPVKEGYVRSLTGLHSIAVDLWMPSESVPLDVLPVDGHQDMYRLRPRTPLQNGFYALHIGGMAAEMPGDRRTAFDIVVGSAKDFPSAAQRNADSELVTKESAVQLVNRMNEMFNKSQYEGVDDVYRPGGKPLTEGARVQFAKDAETWRATAGAILKSEVSNWTASADGDAASGTLQTTYSNSGVQRESIVVKKLAGRYYITDLR